MSACVCAFILTLSTLCGSTGVSGALSVPTNVRLTSFNMDVVLSWDPPAEANSSLVYTTQYRSSITEYEDGCKNISTLECDFTRLDIHIFEYATYRGRVRAQLGAESSDWVESNDITLDLNTTIGPPDVSLFSNGATIDVRIKDPVFRVSELKSVYGFVSYNITYWKKGQKEKAKSVSHLPQNLVVLSNLDPWTMYCVQVQIDAVRNSNPRKPSRTVCESTTNKEEAPWVAAVVTFIVLAVALTLVVVALVYRKSILHFLFPKDALPQHFKEYLLAPPSSSMHSHPPEEVFHKVSIIADSRTVEEGCPLEAEGTSCSKDPAVPAEER